MTEAEENSEFGALTRAVREAIDGQALALDRALMLVSARLLARIDRRLPSDVRSMCGPEDLLQETFTDAFRAFGTYKSPRDRDEGEAFFRWLCTIAEHRIVDAVRSQRAVKRGGAGSGSTDGGRARHGLVRAGGGRGTQTSLAPLIELLAVHSWTPSRSASGREVEAALGAALQTLYPPYREALELRYLLGLSPAEVATRLGRGEDAVHKLCGRAIGALREAMTEATGETPDGRPSPG